MAGLSGNIDHLNPIEVEVEVGLGLSLAKSDYISSRQVVEEVFLVKFLDSQSY